jgi:uncharacterized membrane protein HdeD (DUF308 family)
VAKSKHRRRTDPKPSHEGPFLPPWASITIGVLAILLGLWLIAKPFESLQALRLYVSAGLIIAGIGEATSGRPKDMPWLSAVVGAVVILAGLAVLLIPGLTLTWTATIVGLGLFTAGLIRIVEGISTPEDRLVRVGGGVAMLIIGLLALASPDVTVKTVALLVGPATFVFGIGQILAAFPASAPASAGTTGQRPSPHGR